MGHGTFDLHLKIDGSDKASEMSLEYLINNSIKLYNKELSGK